MKERDELPDEFSSYEEAAEFWDKHDTTDYLDMSQPVEIVSEFRGRYYEIEIDASLADELRERAKGQGMTASHLASDLIKNQLALLKRTRAAA